MKTRITSTFLAAMLYLVSATASAETILHIWSCDMNDDKTQADVMAVSSAWLAAAKGMEGGADLKVYVDFPLAASEGDGAFSWVLQAADAKTWGEFMDGYDGSAAQEADQAFTEVASCSGSAIWVSAEVE